MSLEVLLRAVILALSLQILREESFPRPSVFRFTLIRYNVKAIGLCFNIKKQLFIIIAYAQVFITFLTYSVLFKNVVLVLFLKPLNQSKRTLLTCKLVGFMRFKPE